MNCELNLIVMEILEFNADLKKKIFFNSEQYLLVNSIYYSVTVFESGTWKNFQFQFLFFNFFLLENAVQIFFNYSNYNNSFWG